MFHHLHHRSLWSLDALSGDDVLALLETARALKRAGVPPRTLRGKNIALLSDTPGNGHVAAFEGAATGLGAQVARIRPGASPGTPYAANGTARVLGRLYDAVDCEGLDPRYVQQIDRDAGVPVYNGLAGSEHPTHALAVLLGLQERTGKPLAQLRVAYLGDSRTRAGDALLQAAALTGMELRVAAPREHWPADERMRQLQAQAQRSGARLSLLESESVATEGADCVLEARQVEPTGTPTDDQRYMLQAMLLSTIS